MNTENVKSKNSKLSILVIINRLFNKKCQKCGSKRTKKMYAYNGPDFTCGYDIEYNCENCGNIWMC